MAAHSKTQPQVFEYLDYRKYLRDWVQAAREAKSFSERAFAEKAGFGSPSYLRMIIEGKRNLSAKSLKSLGLGLELARDEAQFFEALVIFNQTSELAPKTEAYRKLLAFKKFQRVQKLQSESYSYWSRWENVALREALASDQSPAEIGRRLGLGARELEQSLALLVSLGLIEKSSNGALRPTRAALKTEAEVKSVVVRDFHRQMIGRALESLDAVAPERRDVSSLTIALSERNLDEIKRRVAAFRNELNALFSEDPEADQVYQFNFQVFPLLDEKGGK